MRQAADAAKDKAKEEKPVDPVVAAMTGESLLSHFRRALLLQTNRGKEQSLSWVFDNMVWYAYTCAAQ